MKTDDDESIDISLDVSEDEELVEESSAKKLPNQKEISIS